MSSRRRRKALDSISLARAFHAILGDGESRGGTLPLSSLPVLVSAAVGRCRLKIAGCLEVEFDPREEVLSVQMNRYDLGDTRFLHRYSVQHVATFHRPLVVCDQHELRPIGHLRDHTYEPADIRVV